MLPVLLNDPGRQACSGVPLQSSESLSGMNGRMVELLNYRGIVRAHSAIIEDDRAF